MDLATQASSKPRPPCVPPSSDGGGGGVLRAQATKRVPVSASTTGTAPAFVSHIEATLVLMGWSGPQLFPLDVERRSAIAPVP